MQEGDLSRGTEKVEQLICALIPIRFQSRMNGLNFEATNSGM